MNQVDRRQRLLDHDYSEFLLALKSDLEIGGRDYCFRSGNRKVQGGCLVVLE